MQAVYTRKPMLTETTGLLLHWNTQKSQQANTYSGHRACSMLRVRVVISKNIAYRNENQDDFFFSFI